MFTHDVLANKQASRPDGAAIRGFASSSLPLFELNARSLAPLRFHAGYPQRGALMP